ncbi:MAG: CHAT domain-containing protein [Hyphomicrobiales bacterium]
MPRTIVTIDFGIDGNWELRLEKAPANISEGRRPSPFKCNPDRMPSWDAPHAVKLHGQTLLAALKSNPAVKQAIEQALSVPPGGMSPVYFQLNERAAEQLCWETLYSDETSFIGLDSRWPIGRIADSVVDWDNAPPSFKPPLKIAAVLSALNRSAAGQWAALRQAVSGARGSGLECKVLVLVGEEDLLENIKAAGADWVTVAPVPDRTQDFARKLSEFGPHIMHFFCHGSASHNVPRLEVATILDWMDGAKTGSLKLSVEALQAMPALAKVWLVVLNCCESSRAVENSHSMAYSLVTNVVQAAIGTLEPFDVADAHELAAGLYEPLLQRLADILAVPGQENFVELEWATALRGARHGLSERHGSDPHNHRQWALPVLYTRKAPFWLRVAREIAIPPAQVAAWKRRAEVVAGELRALPPSTSKEVRSVVLGVIEDVPSWLKPDLSGNFEQSTNARADPGSTAGIFVD